MSRRRRNQNAVPADLSTMSGMLRGFDPDIRDRILSGVESGALSMRDIVDFLGAGPDPGIGSSKGPRDSGRESRASKSVEVAPPVELHRELREAVEVVVDEIPEASIGKAREIDAVVKLKDSDLQTGIQGSVVMPGRKAHECSVTMDQEAYTVDYSCSCSKQYCIPFTYFALSLLNQLDDLQSPLCVKIFGRDGVAQMEKQRKEAEEKELQRVQDRLFRSLQNAGGSTGLLSLDEQTEAAAERVVWNFFALGPDSAGGPHVEFKAVIQKEKKSGGWGKGREVGMKKFMEMSRDCWTATDRKISTHIKYERWNYNVEYSCDGISKALEGSKSFELNRSPATMEIRPLEVVVLDVSGGGWGLITSSVALRNEWGDDAVGLSLVDGNVVFSNSKGAVVWFPVSEGLRDLVEVIKADNVWFREDQRDVLLQKLNSLDTTVPVRLPPSLVSEVRPVAADPVLLLRMKKTGSLEATLCVRDNRQLLMHAGDGQLRRLEIVDDVPVQFVRDGVAERQAVKELERHLMMGQFMSIRESTWLIDDPEAVVDLLRRAAEQVDQGELVLIWHKESVKQINIIGSLSSANVSVKVTKQRDWFNVNGSCRFGDQEVRLKDVLEGLRGTSSMDGLIEVSAGQWASIADDFRATLQMLADSANDTRGKLQLDQSAAMSLAAIDEKALDIKADKAWQKCLDKVRSIESISPDPPASLDCDFRDYQLDGFRWMCRLAEWGVGGILADDMGLGKTVQTLAVLLQRTESGPALVIAPTSLGFNWESECHKFAPSLSPKLLRDGDRQKLIESATEGDVIICSYGLALRESELLQTVDWGTLVLDEAQNIKNSNTKTAKEVRKLSAGWKVALTGTPMENHLGELWSIFRAVSPGVLGSWEQFRKKFAAPIEKEDNNERRVALSRVIAPFILRRTKKEVLTDLPDRLESNLLIELTKEEQERYDQVRLAAVGELDELGGEELSSDQRFKVLQLLTRLRQISCHVGLIDETWKHGSSKLRMLMERLEQLKERGHRALIFSQFTSHLGLIKEACDAAGISYQYLDGQTTPKARQQRVELFQNGEGDVFLISLKAGGTGLNLTAADYVIHMDPWWNPAVEDQATDRAHRIGQQNNVMVYRIIAKGTIEEQIISLHAEKRDLVEGVLSGSEASGKMSTEQLATLIRDGVTATV